MVAIGVTGLGVVPFDAFLGVSTLELRGVSKVISAEAEVGDEDSHPALDAGLHLSDARRGGDTLLSAVEDAGSQLALDANLRRSDRRR